MKKKLLSLMLITLMLFCGCKADDPTPALAAAVDAYIQGEAYEYVRFSFCCCKRITLSKKKEKTLALKVISV